MKRSVEAEKVDSDHGIHDAWDRQRSRPITRCPQVASLARLMLKITAGVGGIALVVHRVDFLGESRRLVAPVAETGVDKTAHDDKIRWSGELDARTPDKGGSHLRGVSRPFEMHPSLEEVPRRILQRGRDNQLADLSGGIQDARDSAVQSAIGPIGDDQSIPLADAMVVEIDFDPSITKHVSGAESVSTKGDDTALAALAGVNGQPAGKIYRQQLETLLERTPVEPAAAAMAPGQVSLKEQEHGPRVENIRARGPEQRLELGNGDRKKHGEGGNQQQGRSQELNLLQQPQGEKQEQEQEQTQKGMMRQQQQLQQQVRQQQQQQEQRGMASADVEALLKSQIEDIQDHQGRQEQEQGHQQQHRPQPYQNAEQKHQFALTPGHPEFVDEHAGVTSPLLAEDASSAPLYESFLQGAGAVWSRLLEALSSTGACLSPPCAQGKQTHTDFTDLGEMTRVRGSVVVRRPDLTQSSNLLRAAAKLDFAKMMQSYSPMLRYSLFSSLRSDLLEAKRLADAADHPNGDHVEGTDAVGPLPAQAGMDIEPERVSIPEGHNRLKEDASRSSSVFSAVAGYGGAPESLSQVQARMHQPQSYEEYRESRFVTNFVKSKRGEGGQWGENEKHGGSDGGSSSLFDETATQYWEPEEEEEEDKVEAEVERQEEEEEQEDEEEKDKEKKYHASSALYFSSYSGRPYTMVEKDEKFDEQYDSARSWSSFPYVLDPSETEAKEIGEGLQEAETESDDKQYGVYRRNVPAESDEGREFQYGFDSSTDDDLRYMHREPDGGFGLEDATERYELYSDYDVFFTTETTEPWLRQRESASEADPTAREVGHLAGELLPADISFVEGEPGKGIVFGAEGAEEGVFDYALPAPGVETQRKLRYKSAPIIVQD